MEYYAFTTQFYTFMERHNQHKTYKTVLKIPLPDMLLDQSDLVLQTRLHRTQQTG